MTQPLSEKSTDEEIIAVIEEVLGYKMLEYQKIFFLAAIKGQRVTLTLPRK